MSVFGMRRPPRFAAVFVVQVVYKIVWLAFVLLPLLLAGELRADTAVVAAVSVLATTVCLVATPWSHPFGGEKAPENRNPSQKGAYG